MAGPPAPAGHVRCAGSFAGLAGSWVEVSFSGAVCVAAEGTAGHDGGAFLIVTELGIEGFVFEAWADWMVTPLVAWVLKFPAPDPLIEEAGVTFSDRFRVLGGCQDRIIS